MGKRIVLADPRGFCAGVDRAILTVRTILKSADTPRADGLPPVYVRRQIVHNKHVVEDLAAQGAVFVQELAEIPDAAAEAGIPIVFSAHGVSPAVKAEAAARGMHVVDATCPLVSKVHREVLRFVKEGYEIIYIGHKGHDEAVGVVEESPEHVHLIEHASDVDSLDFQPDTKLVLLTQTTLSVDETAGTITALKARFPWLEMPPNSDICYATSNRQAAVKLVAEHAWLEAYESIEFDDDALSGDVSNMLADVYEGCFGGVVHAEDRPKLIAGGNDEIGGHSFETRIGHAMEQAQGATQ